MACRERYAIPCKRYKSANQKEDGLPAGGRRQPKGHWPGEIWDGAKQESKLARNNIPAAVTRHFIREFRVPDKGGKTAPTAALSWDLLFARGVQR